MAYTKTTWQKRIVEYPDRYSIDGTYKTITPEPGTVTQAGTPLTEAALNNLETQYDEAVSYVDTNVKPYIVPSGGIIMWSGTLANIPSGWVLCDGNNSTPNLLDRFVQSVPNSSTNPGVTGGDTSKTTAGHAHELPFAFGSYYNIYWKNYGSRYGNIFGTGSTSRSTNVKQTCTYLGDDGPSLKFTLSQNVTDSISDIRPKYYQIAFIMKT